MATEIERKFLIHPDEWEVLLKPSPRKIKQAYICKEENKVTRVRIKDDKAFLTIKGNSLNKISRLEFEYEIPIEDAHEMIINLGGSFIEKDRFEIKNGKHIWEVDVFHGDNEGLIIAEIELTTEEESFEKPDWLGAEVSEDNRYFNVYLETKPFKTW